MNSRNVCLSSILLLATIQVSCASFISREEEAVIEKEEAAVIRAYVDSNLEKLFWEVKHTGKPLRTIYVNSVTARMERDWQKSFSELSPAPASDTVISFISRNDGEYAVNSRLKFSLPHIIMPHTTFQKILEQEDGLNVLYSRDPSYCGIIWISRVGFNTNKTQALFYICCTQKQGDGEGHIILMEKSNGNWREIASDMLWTE